MIASLLISQSLDNERNTAAHLHKGGTLKQAAIFLLVHWPHMNRIPCDSTPPGSSPPDDAILS